MPWRVLREIRQAPLESAPPRHRLEAHEGAVYGACWLGDDRILSWGGDWTLRLWEPTSGRLLRTFDDPARTMVGHGGIRGALPLSNGRVVSWGGDGTIHVWDLGNAHPVARLTGHTSAVSGVRSVDEQRLISWSGDGTVRLWHLDGTPRSEQLGYSGAFDDMLAACPPFILDDGKGLTGWAFDELTHIPLTGYGTPIHVGAGDADLVTCLQLHSGRIIAFAEDGMIREWSVPELRCVFEYAPLPTRPRGVCRLADGRFAAWYAGRLAVFQPGEAVAREYLDPPDSIIEAAPLPSEGIVFRTVARRLAAWAGGLRWEAELPEGREPVRLQVALDGSVLAWSMKDRWLQLSRSDGTATVAIDGGSVLGAVQHPDPSRLPRPVLAWSDGGEVYCWALEVAPPSGVVPALSSAVGGLCAVSDGELLAWHDGGELSLHILPSGARTNALKPDAAHRGRLRGALVAPGHRAIAWDAAENLYVWDLDRGELVGNITESDGPVGPTVLLGTSRAVSWSRLRDRSGFLHWDLDRVAPIAVLDDRGGAALGTVSLGEREFLTWSEAPDLRRWDVAGNLLETIPVHERGVAGLVETAGGLLSWTESGELALWSPGAGLVRSRLHGVSGEVVGGTVDREDVLFWCDDGSVLTWSPVQRTRAHLLHRARGFVTFAAAVSDRRWLLCDDSGEIALCGRGVIVKQALRPGRAEVVALSADRRWLGVADNRRITVFAVDHELEPVATLDVEARITVLHGLPSALALGLANGEVRIAAP